MNQCTGCGENRSFMVWVDGNEYCQECGFWKRANDYRENLKGQPSWMCAGITTADERASTLTRGQKLAQLDREGLGPALDMMLDLFVGHGLHKHGHAEEQRWRKLPESELYAKMLGHAACGDELDDESGLPQQAHAVMRALMRLQRIIERRSQK